MNTPFNNLNPINEKFKLVSDTIKSYPFQLKQAWEEVKLLNISDDLKNIENIVFCGMGGSALGARMVKSLSQSQIRVSFEIVNDYKIPNYVNSKTLVIVSSYSGSTEETIEATYQAIKKSAKIFGITTGGKLAELLRKEKKDAYVFEPKHNPSNQPRMSIGYASGAVLSLLKKIGVISITDEEIDKSISLMNKLSTEYSEGAPIEKNLAYSYALKIKGKVPVLIASEHLVGVAHTIKNQFNESAKTFSILFDLPELNHHLMEGLKYPVFLKKYFLFIFISSKIYFDKVLKRYSLTNYVVEKNGYPSQIYTPISEEKISQVFETLVFGSYVVYYLTKLYKIDPLEIPWVDYFKDQLAKG